MKITKGCFSTFPHLMCKGLPAYEQITFIWLFHHANADGMCFPSLATLVDECGISKDTVVKSLKKLEKRGYISRKRNMTIKGGYHSTRYIVHFLNNVVANTYKAEN
jgi:DNA-binding transcriptional regulator YhcF (GntR family)